MQRVNRRCYCRVLHVQPDAHDAVIRTAYHTLMHKLRLHPDLGSDGDGGQPGAYPRLRSVRA